MKSQTHPMFEWQLSAKLPQEWGKFGLGSRHWRAQNREPPAENSSVEGATNAANFEQNLELVTDLVGPEAFEANQGLVECLQVIVADTTHLLKRAELALIQTSHHLADL
jgi:hypothetical protein